MLAGGAPPEVEPPAQATGTLDLELPSLADLPGIPSAEPELASAVPDRPAPLPSDDATTVVEGRWILVQTGFWKRGFDAGGSEGRIRITGSVSTEQERVEAEGRLLAAAGGQPMDLAISVLAPRAAASGIAATAGVGRSRSTGGLVRASLLEHYRDAARRSFQEPDRSLLESELERYVSEILRHDAELLSHAHALDSLLSRLDMAEAVRQRELPPRWPASILTPSRVTRPASTACCPRHSHAASGRTGAPAATTRQELKASERPVPGCEKMRWRSTGR